MQKKLLGNSDLEITPLGIGAWAMGGVGYAFSWGAQDDDDSIAAINHAFDLGINWIDTAAVYGLGHSEEVVAKAIKGRSDRPYVFTKCERVWDADGKISPCLKAESVRRECEASLRRLDVDTIDLYQIHWPDPIDDIEEGWATLAELKEEGKLRHIGVSNFNAEQLARIQRIAPITSLQPPYSAVRRDYEAETLTFCAAHNIGVIVYSPMQSGLLTGSMTRERIESLPENDWRSRGPQFKEPLLSRNLAVAEALSEIANSHGRTTAEAAIAWTLHNPAVTAAIVGARNPKQVDGFIGAMEFRLSEAEVAAVNAVADTFA